MRRDMFSPSLEKYGHSQETLDESGTVQFAPSLFARGPIFPENLPDLPRCYLP
jgi:hypothetical protein